MHKSTYAKGLPSFQYGEKNKMHKHAQVLLAGEARSSLKRFRFQPLPLKFFTSQDPGVRQQSLQ